MDAKTEPGDGTGDRALDDQWVELELARNQIEQLRTDLLATVAHELRTPLTLIRTSIGLLLDDVSDPDMERRLLFNIKLSADRMHLLVTDLLDLARLRSGQAEMYLRSVDVAEMVEAATRLMQPLFDSTNQKLTTTVPEPSPRIVADPRRIERVLLNLLSNAHKFAPERSTIVVDVQNRDDGVEFSVSDSGPGIPDDVMPRLFEQFYTGRTSSSSHDIGVGLGLPIARGIVESHGGRMWVESRVGEGAAFRFVLPWEATGETSE